MDREVTPPPLQGRMATEHGRKQGGRFCTAALLLAVFPGTMLAQTAAPPASPSAVPTSAPAKGGKTPRTGDRRKSVKLYLASSKLFVAERFEEAMRGYQQAATLDPSNADYPLAVEVARSHAVTALVQAAAKDRLRGDTAAARGALAHALELDPKSIQATEHLHELGDDALLGQTMPLYEQAASTIGAATLLTPTAGVHNFHLNTAQRQVIQQVFKAYGIEATVDDSIRPTQIRLDVDEASFEQATHTVSLLTNSFYVPLDAHRVLVARDTPDNRQQFVPQELETVYLPGLTANELTDVGNLAKNVFDAQQSVVEPTAGTLTIRAPETTLAAFNATMRQLLDGHSQVMLEVRMIQLAHTGERNTGAQLPQQVTAFNVYSEEQSILNANAALVQQIISSGLAAPGDTLAILGILLASGQVSSSIFSNGIALFGGGITTSGLSPGPATFNLSLNSSESRELDQIQLRLGDGEAGTLRTGMRYPITTSSFSSLSANSVNIPGLTTAGASSQLSSLLSSLSGSAMQVPQVEYQDLGLTLKATPKVLRNGDVALTIDMKVDALAGQALNGVPVLNSRTYSGVVTVKQGEGVVVLSEVNKQESRAISGVPGLSEIPGLNNLTGKDTQKDYATLLIVITPHVIRGAQAAGHSAQMRVERNTPAR
jgi:Flp pilus assembly secretin CpaC/tetratricopeptide (TPR) repeat protein